MKDGTGTLAACLHDRGEITRELARRSHERFMRHTWQNPSEPFVVGIHTKYICSMIDRAMDDLEGDEARGIAPKSTFLVIKVPFRHGKSQMLSRYLPPHFLGRFPDKEVMLVTYASALAEGFSRYARNIVRTEEFRELYPGVEISRESGGVQQWGIEGHLGGCAASGLTSGLTGKGYHLGLLDDFNASRADAESDVIRGSQWEHFTNDFLTRRAPVAVTIVLATPWHVDDIIGRIERRLDPDSEDYDPNFPPFRVISFPAMGGDFELDGERIKYDYLFPERFSPEWYSQQEAALGAYSASALLQCNPVSRGGNIIDVSRVKIHDSAADFPATRYYRVWDLAHTAAQTQKDDPDWTSGTLLAYRKKEGAWELWIKDVARIRAASPERDNYIRAVTEKDGAGVAVCIENSVEARDAVNHMRTILSGRRSVRAVNCKGDKVSRMSYVEPIFEGGNVHILRGDWNRDWLEELAAFPSGRHDDQVDNISAGYEMLCPGGGRAAVARLVGI